MINESCNIWTKRTAQLIVVFAILSTMFGTGGCVSPPRLTAEDRRSDIEFLAHWARDYSPLVELNEKHKGIPSYEALLPKYAEFAEQAQSDEEFCLVVSQYFRIIGAYGHAYQLPDNALKWLSLGSLLGICKYGISSQQFEQARYWAKLAANLSIFAHPPFRVISREDRYFTDDDWQYDGTTVPKGSEILKVNGMPPHLMIIEEGPSFNGWQVDFRLPDGADLSAFVPKVKGRPAPKKKKVHTTEPKDNCTCLELTDDVGYIRIKSFAGHPTDIHNRYIKKERKVTSTFLEQSRGKYSKLIIDVRNNGGGDPAYFYDNLICPFLDQPVTYKYTVGLKRRFLEDTKPSVLHQLRKVAVLKHETGIKEVTPPEGFDAKEWIFYEITRRLEPSQRFPFKGDMYILINGDCYSACDDYANTIKRIGIAALVGQTTAGSGGIGYCAAPLVRLPQSGMIFRLDVHLPLNPDGSFSVLDGLEPDIELPDANPPKSITKEDLLEDEWIKWILADAQDRADRE